MYCMIVPLGANRSGPCVDHAWLRQAFYTGLDSPGKTHGDDSLSPAWPEAMPGLRRHVALHASTLYYFAQGWPCQSSPMLGHFM